MHKFVKTAAAIGALVLAAGAAQAEYPEKPIEVIVGYSAGGGTDVMARTTMPFIEKYLGEGSSIVVKNMPGMMARTLDREAGYDRDSFTYLVYLSGECRE